jgi:predicted DsbA family dithiol-disulfide isomerase
MSRIFGAVIALLIVAMGVGTLQAEKRSGAKEPRSSGIKKLASVDGTVITEVQARSESADELDALELQILRSKAQTAQNEHQIVEEAVERIIKDKLLQAESQKRGVSKEQLLAQEVMQKIAESTPEEIDAFYTTNQQRINRPKEQALSQISKYLRQQQENNLKEKFFSRLEKEHQVIRTIEPLRYAINFTGRPAKGLASAAVQLALFSDFQCPYCGNFNDTIKEVQKKYGDKVRLAFFQFPLTNIHANAERAAEASLCAEDQGRFWEMHDLLFQKQSNLQDMEIRDYAGKLGLDMASFNSCLDSERYRRKVQEDLRAGSAAGVDGTPALFINGRLLSGSRPLEDITNIIEEELKLKK